MRRWKRSPMSGALGNCPVAGKFSARRRHGFQDQMLLRTNRVNPRFARITACGEREELAQACRDRNVCTDRTQRCYHGVTVRASSRSQSPSYAGLPLKVSHSYASIALSSPCPRRRGRGHGHTMDTSPADNFANRTCNDTPALQATSNSPRPSRHVANRRDNIHRKTTAILREYQRPVGSCAATKMADRRREHFGSMWRVPFSLSPVH